MISNYYSTNKSNESADIVYHTMKNYASFAMSRSYGDSESDFHEVLATALKEYDINRNILFKTYFWTCWQNFIGTQKIRKNAKKRGKGVEVLSLNQKVKDGESEKEFGEMLEDKKQKHSIKKALNKIDFDNMLEEVTDLKDKQILKLFYEGLNQTEISKELNITNAAICIRLKRIATKPYAEIIYRTLKGE